MKITYTKHETLKDVINRLNLTSFSLFGRGFFITRISSSDDNLKPMLDSRVNYIKVRDDNSIAIALL